LGEKEIPGLVLSNGKTAKRLARLQQQPVVGE
jgi:hypothetical protein